MKIQEAQLLYNNAILQEQLDNIDQGTQIELSKIGSNITEEVDALGKELDDVYCAIKAASMKKKNSLIYDGKLSEITRNRLKEDGFVIEEKENKYVVSGWVKETQIEKESIYQKLKILSELNQHDPLTKFQIKGIEYVINILLKKINYCKDLEYNAIKEKEPTDYNFIVKAVENISKKSKFEFAIWNDVRLQDSVVSFFKEKSILINSTTAAAARKINPSLDSKKDWKYTYNITVNIPKKTTKKHTRILITTLAFITIILSTLFITSIYSGGNHGRQTISTH